MPGAAPMSPTSCTRPSAGLTFSGPALPMDSYAVKVSISLMIGRGCWPRLPQRFLTFKTNIKNIEAQSFEDRRGLIHVTIVKLLT